MIILNRLRFYLIVVKLIGLLQMQIIAFAKYVEVKTNMDKTKQGLIGHYEKTA